MIKLTKFLLFCCFLVVVASHQIPPTTKQEGRHLLESSVDGKPRVFFLMLTYNLIYNSDIWKMFLTAKNRVNNNNTSSINEAHYSFLVHSTKHSILPFDGFKFNLIDTVYSRYCDLVDPMVALLSEALKLSKHENDHFIFLSADSLPIKPFHAIYQHFTKANQPSTMCITPTNQWDKNLPNGWILPKTHQWVTFNRADALKVTTSEQNRDPLLKETYASYRTKASAGEMMRCTEEYEFHSMLHGKFNATSQTSDDGTKWKYPYDLEQDHCSMYVHWEGYPAESQFLRDGIPDLSFPNQHLMNVDGSFLQTLKKSKGFFFARKIRTDHIVKPVGEETRVFKSSDNKKETISLPEYFANVSFYQHQQHSTHSENTIQ